MGEGGEVLGCDRRLEPAGKCCDGAVPVYAQRGRIHDRGESGHTAALCPAKRSRPDRHAIRLRQRSVRRLLRPDRRSRHPRLRYAPMVDCRQERHHHRRPWARRQAPSSTGSFPRRAGSAVRLLHERRIGQRRGAPCEEPGCFRSGRARRARSQPVPLRLAQSHGARGAARGRQDLT